MRRRRRDGGGGCGGSVGRMAGGGAGCRVVVVPVAAVGVGRDGAGACGGHGDCIFYCFQKCLPCFNSGARQCLIHFMGKMFFQFWVKWILSKVSLFASVPRFYLYPTIVV
jgi:hypothetical protein